jgi:uncharacterized protein (DUF58 family)
MKIEERIDIRNLGNLDMLARQVVEGFIIGLHKSPFHGFSVEFAEHRIYNPGDSTRNIDWKVYARTDKMFTKRFEEETNLRCQIVVDVSSSMYFPEAGSNSEREGYMNKLRFSALASASLMNLLRKQRDAYGLTLFDSELHLHTPCKSSTTHYQLLISKLQELIDHPQPNRSTSAAQALHTVADSIHRRSMVIIFSDMFDSGENSDDLFSALQHLKHNKHEVILFHVVDKSKELDFDYENRPYLFVDMETGEELRLQSNQVKDYYVEQIAKYKEALRLKCLQYKIDFVEADIHEGFKKILQSYLVKRNRMGT